MAIRKAEDRVGVIRRAAISLQVSVALRAVFIARGPQIDSAAMLVVALRASHIFGGHVMMNRAVVATKASTVFSFLREDAGLLHVARRAIIGKHRVRLGHASAD